MFKFLDKYKGYAPSIVRIGVSLVFLWFGISQLINPESFLGYLPQWFYSHPLDMMHEHSLQMLHSLPLKPHFVIMSNGVFETLFGTLLLLGVLTRISALLLALHLIGIIIGIGYNDIAVRDFGLMILTFSVFLNGSDKFCLENIFRLKKK